MHHVQVGFSSCTACNITHKALLDSLESARNYHLTTYWISSLIQGMLEGGGGGRGAVH